MRIGYCVEGALDVGLVRGLAARWCPEAELVQGSFRGSTGQRLRAEIPLILTELGAKGADLAVFLTDSNSRGWREASNPEWRSRLKAQREAIPAGCPVPVVCGVTDRNVECWLIADPAYATQHLGLHTTLLTESEDPKRAVEAAFAETTGFVRPSLERVSTYVREAPLRAWIQASPSFADFYDELRSAGKLTGCEIPNERERTPASAP